MQVTRRTAIIINVIAIIFVAIVYILTLTALTAGESNIPIYSYGEKSKLNQGFWIQYQARKDSRTALESLQQWESKYFLVNI